MIEVKLYDTDGTYLDDLKASDVIISVDGTRSVRQTANFTVPISTLAALRIYGRQIIMTDQVSGDELFTGYYDDVIGTADLAEGTVRVSCRDKTKTLKEAAFDEDVSYTGNGSSSTISISSASATSELSTGYEMQDYAEVYDQDITVYELGVAKRVNDAQVSGDIRDGDLSIQASGSNVQKVVLNVYLDLKASEDLQQIRLDHTGYAEAIEVSTDGQTWTDYTSGTVTCRYIHLQVTGNLSFTAGVKVYAGTDYPVTNALTDNEDSWRPALSDLQREITLDLGSSQQVNVLYLRWGLNDAERRTLVRYEILAQIGNKYRSLGTWYSNAGYSEAVFNDTTTRYIKVRIISTWEGRPALRYAKVMMVTSTQTIDQIINTVAAGEGETLFDLTSTKRRTKLTFEAGQQKWDALQEMVSKVLGNWELFYSADGYLTLRPVILRTDNPRAITALLPPFTIAYSDAGVKNEIIAIHEGQNSTIRHVAQNNNAASSTSIPQIGKRSIVLNAPLADTEEKLVTFAQRELVARGRVTVPAQATIAAGEDHDPFDIWHVNESKTDTDGLFILSSFTITAFTITANKERAIYDVDAQLEAV